jgi:hypothetical protein
MERDLELIPNFSSILSLGALAANSGGVDVTELTSDVDLSVDECLEMETL